MAPATGTSSFWRQSKRVLGRDWPVAYLFIAPLVILLFGLIAYPLVRGVILSFYNVTGITNRGFVGFQNYIDVFTQPVLKQTSFYQLFARLASLRETIS